jgi:hypothetical protein
MSDEHAQGIKQSIEDIIGNDTVLKRKRKTEEDINRESFEKIILLLDEVQVRGALLHTDLGLDYSNYDEKFYEIIDRMFTISFGKEAAEIIFFYVYERINPDGSINELLDQNNDVISLNTPTDLWYLISNIKNKTKKVTPKK